jgi:transcriptional regulator with XRE-family HTH domain
MQTEKDNLLRLIGQHIKAKRKERNIEIKEISKLLKITIQAYGNIENGKTDINVSRIVEICKVLNVSIEELLDLKQGDIYNYNSQNNSGGFHLQKVDVLNAGNEKVENVLNRLEVLIEKLTK